MGWAGVQCPNKAMDPEKSSKAIKSYPYSKCLLSTDVWHMFSLYPHSVQGTEHLLEPYSTYCSALPIK